MKKIVTKFVVLILFFMAVVVVLTLKSRSKESDTVLTTAVVDSVEVKRLPKLLELGSHSCIPCKMMMPILDTLRDVHAGRLDIGFIDVWKDREAGEKYNIRSIPTQIIYDADGKELFRHTGFWSRECIEAKIEELGIPLREKS